MKGNLFEDDDVEAITNAINCVGVMGGGIALEFKNRYPLMFQQYQAACQLGKVKPGEIWVWNDPSEMWIMNFPTKNHWRDPSEEAYIASGLIDLTNVLESLAIKSIAIPMLGCGLGGLKTSDIIPLIYAAFDRLPAIDVHLYVPN